LWDGGSDQFLKKVGEQFLVDWLKIVKIRGDPGAKGQYELCRRRKNTDLAFDPEISTSQGNH